MGYDWLVCYLHLSLNTGRSKQILESGKQHLLCLRSSKKEAELTSSVHEIVCNIATCTFWFLYSHGNEMPVFESLKPGSCFLQIQMQSKNLHHKFETNISQQLKWAQLLRNIQLQILPFDVKNCFALAVWTGL